MSNSLFIVVKSKNKMKRNLSKSLKDIVKNYF